MYLMKMKVLLLSFKMMQDQHDQQWQQLIGSQPDRYKPEQIVKEMEHDEVTHEQ
jgi:hypothetical protein